MIFLNEPIGSRHNLPRGAVILLHIQHLGVRVDGIELGQRLRVCGAEAINTLILIANHKQVAALPSQQSDDGMLNFRSILRFVHAKILIARLHRAQDFGVLPQNPKGINHLVIVVHQLSLAQRLIIRRKECSKIDPFHLDCGQRFPFEHLVFGIGERSLERFDRAFRSKLLALHPIQLADERTFLCAILQKPKGGAAHRALVIANDPAAHPVDGAKFQTLRFFCAEKSGVPRLHIPCSGYRVGHGEDALGRNAPHIAHISQPRHQNGGLAAARYCEQQHRPVHSLYRCFLLRIQRNRILCFELGKIHAMLRVPMTCSTGIHRYFHPSVPGKTHSLSRQNL